MFLFLLLIIGDDVQAVECQVECARLMCTMAGRAASVLTGGGALAAIEGMLERLGGKHRSERATAPPFFCSPVAVPGLLI